MPAYVQDFLIDHQFGYGYIVTNAALVLAVVLLLRDFPRAGRGAAAALAEWAVCCCVYVAMDSVWYVLLGAWQMDRLVLGLFILLYALLRCRYEPRVRLVRGMMFLAGAMVILPISEPLGEAMKAINESWFAWGQYLTPAVMVLLSLGIVWFLRHYAIRGDILGTWYVWLQCFISAITIGIEAYASFSGEAQEYRLFNVLVCLGLLATNLMAYYLFYTIDRGAAENIRLTALNQKAELEKEKYHATKLNYEELRAIRHEIKNHNFYMKALLDEGRVEEASAYLDRVSQKGTKYLKSFDSGNYVVDVVMNHEMAVAKEMGVTLEAQILVPRQLPFRDEDVCSLLSNLLDNAMEAAAQSGAEDKTVHISMMPRQEYLFIRVTNPVDERLPARRRLTLETTKEKDAELHGFGTRIIRRVTERYNGSVKYNQEDGVFTTNVMLEMPEEETA